MNKKRVVVTGLGVISSIGIGVQEFWKNACAGLSGISEVNLFNTDDQFTKRGGEVKTFKPEDFIDRRKLKFYGRASKLSIAAAKLALKDAGINLGGVNKERVSVFFGTTSGESQEIESMDKTWLKEGKDKVKINSILQYPINNISSNVAVEFKFTGANRMFTNACAAGNYAIGYGCDILQSDEADYIVAGGSDVFSYIVYTGFNQLGAVAPEKCQPFDKNRKGMIPGEGAGVLILETLENAKKRNAPVYAEILGYGLSCDAFHMTQPNADGVSACMEKALKEAHIKPEDVDYICAHGTGTKFNDKTESSAINRVFGGRKVAVSSVKSMIGHTMGAASAIEAAVCCLTVKNDIITPTINFETPDAECDIDCVPNKARGKKVQIALNNAFAFGGNNSCLVIKKYAN